jgi:hypothetical protein
MKIFIICCLLFIQVNMCIFIRGFQVSFGFQVSVRVSGIRGFGFGDGFPPESVFGLGSCFDFGFQFWVHKDSTQSEPDPLPSLDQTQLGSSGLPYLPQVVSMPCRLQKITSPLFRLQNFSTPAIVAFSFVFDN